MLYPIKVVDIELSRPLQTIEGLDGYMGLQGLVRLHGVPIGYVKAPITNGYCPAQTLSKLILEQHSWKIIQQLLQNGLATPQRLQELRIEDLLELPPPECTEPLPLVTVAVCTRDRPKDLALCLKALCQLDYPNLDLLVVDNAPTNDETKKLVHEQYPQVRYVRESRPGLDWARNRAILEAQGEIIAYTDDDVVVDRGWVKALAQVFAESPDVMAVTGLIVPYELETEAQVLFEMCGGFGKGFETKCFYVKPGDRTPWWFLGTGNCGAGANMAYRRCVFEKVGYFDPALDVGTVTNGGGDQEMFFRIIKSQYVLMYTPRAMVWHRHRRDYTKLRSQMSGNGGAYAYMTRSILNYPDELFSFLRLGIFWFVSWHLRRFLISLIHPVRYPRDLILAEIQGCLAGLTSYFKAKKKAIEIEKSFGPLFFPKENRSIDLKKVKNYRNGIAIRTVDLSQPVQAITDIAEYPRTQLLITQEGALLDKLEMENGYRNISADWLRETLVNKLGLKLLKSNCSSGDHRWIEAVSSLRQHYTSFPVARETFESMNRLPLHTSVSVVIGTYDRPENLRSCLKSLIVQKTLRQLEIIVVDNHPMSGLTPPIVAEFPGVHLIDEPRKGSSYARNAGIVRSKGEIIVSIDDDVIAPPQWLEYLLSPFSRPDVMVVTGNILPLELEHPAQCLFECYGGLGRGSEPFEVAGDWFELFPHKPSPTWWLGATANAAFRASIFSHPQIGLMDERLGAGAFSGVGEDTYVFYKVLKAGYTIFYESKAYVLHQHRNSMAAFKSQIYNYSKGHVAYNLVTWLNDGDWRGLAQVLIGLPLAQIRKIKAWLFRQSSYPISLIVLEALGNLAGPWSLWQSHRYVQQEGGSAPYQPITKYSQEVLFKKEVDIEDSFLEKRSA